MSYATAKGRFPAAEQPVRQAAVKELTDEQMAEVAGRVRLVKEHIPEAWDFVKALHAEGLVDGMRCVESVTVFEGKNDGLA